MELKDWITVVFGAVGSAAGVSAALWVFKRERQERSQTAERERQQRDRRAEAQRTEDADRHARAVRRAKYEDDYRALEAVLESWPTLPGRSPSTSRSLHGKRKRVERARKRPSATTARLPSLQYQMSAAEYAAFCILSRAPGGIRPRSIDDPALDHTSWEVLAQYNAALETPAAVERAKKALNAEWEEPR